MGRLADSGFCCAPVPVTRISVTLVFAWMLHKRENLLARLRVPSAIDAAKLDFASEFILRVVGRNATTAVEFELKQYCCGDLWLAGAGPAERQ